MDKEKELPKRKSTRLGGFDYNKNGAYFITICTKNKINLFWEKNQPDFVGEDIILPHKTNRNGFETGGRGRPPLQQHHGV